MVATNNGLNVTPLSSVRQKLTLLKPKLCVVVVFVDIVITVIVLLRSMNLHLLALKAVV